MKHVFTAREKVLLVILAVLLIAVGYWKLILTPNDSIAQLQSQTSSEQDAMLQSTAQLARLQQMKRELETLLADPDAKPLPAYDNAEQLLVELNTILSGAVEYTLNFASTYPLEEGSSIVCRPIALVFTASTYEGARAVLDALHGSDYVNQISDLTMDLDARSGIQTTLTITYFELQGSGSAS